MGAKTWMLVSSDGDVRDSLAAQPQLDRRASLELAKRLFPQASLTEGKQGSLCFTNPGEDEILVGCFGDVAVVAATEFGLDYPSQLPKFFLQNMPHPLVFLHAMHSVVDWCAFAVWKDGKLIRSLSLSSDRGILEDIGERFPFEEPYWNGELGTEDEDEEEEYPLPFQPLELAEEALAFFFGYTLGGCNFTDVTFTPTEVPLIRLSKKSRAESVPPIDPARRRQLKKEAKRRLEEQDEQYRKERLEINPFSIHDPRGFENMKAEYLIDRKYRKNVRRVLRETEVLQDAVIRERHLEPGDGVFAHPRVYFQCNTCKDLVPSAAEIPLRCSCKSLMIHSYPYQYYVRDQRYRVVELKGKGPNTRPALIAWCSRAWLQLKTFFRSALARLKKLGR